MMMEIFSTLPIRAMDHLAAVQAFNSQDTDILAYVGPVDRSGYDALCRVLRGTPRKKNCVFAIVTFGGDPNAGYRIARALSHNYPDGGKISVLVPDFCKSAGTLVCIGAHELVIADRGELGPLDIQVQKPDEMFKNLSGLDIIRGLAYLQDAALETFRGYLVDINQGSGLSTKSASEIASKLTIGLHEPIFAQIDPIRLGEMQAALTIALDYGSRLNQRYGNLKPNALSQLTNAYPAHGFVIDRKEARSLFNNVRCPEQHEIVIGDWVAGVFAADPRRSSGAVVDCATIFVADQSQQATHNVEIQDASSQPSDANIEGQSGSAPDDTSGQQVQSEPANGSHEANSPASESN